jgi:hypothetical protein
MCFHSHCRRSIECFGSGSSRWSNCLSSFSASSFLHSSQVLRLDYFRSIENLSSLKLFSRKVCKAPRIFTRDTNSGSASRRLTPSKNSWCLLHSAVGPRGGSDTVEKRKFCISADPLAHNEYCIHWATTAHSMLEGLFKLCEIFARLVTMKISVL